MYGHLSQGPDAATITLADLADDFMEPTESRTKPGSVP